MYGQKVPSRRRGPTRTRRSTPDGAADARQQPGRQQQTRQGGKPPRDDERRRDAASRPRRATRGRRRAHAASRTCAARDRAHRTAVRRSKLSGKPARVGRRDEIARAIAAHQVVIVCGETGSGKTTQLPKIASISAAASAPAARA
jgi:ATP-dependent helicase HrpA